MLTPGIEEEHSLVRVVLTAAFFGFIAYATYDLTNLATLSGWSLTVTVVDLIWGVVASALASLSTYLIAKHLLHY